MAISARSEGSYSDTATSATLTVTLPTHLSGDMLIVRAACKSYDTTISCNTSGWAAVGDAYANGTTTNGNGVGSVNHRSFWKVATSSSETNPVITFGATPSPGMGVAVVYQKGSTEVWSTPVGAGGGDATLRTSQTCTISSHISVTAGDMVDFWLAWGDNYAATSPSISQTGVTFGSVTEYPATALSTSTGNDGAMDGGYRLASSGTSSAAAVVTATFGNSEQGGAWQTRLRVTENPNRSGTGSVSHSSAATATGKKTRTGTPSVSNASSATVVGKRAQSSAISTSNTSSTSASGLALETRSGTAAASHTSTATSSGYKNVDYDITASNVSATNIVATSAHASTASESAASSTSSTGEKSVSAAASAVSHTSAATSTGDKATSGTASTASASDATATGYATGAGPSGTVSLTYASQVRLVTKAEYTTPGTPAYYRSAAVSTDDDAHTTLTIAKPAGALEDDLLFAAIDVARVPHASITGPDGWTKLANSVDYAEGSLSMWTKVAGASEPADYSWTHANSTSTGAILAIIDASDTIIANPAGSTGDSANPDSPTSGTITQDDYLVLSVFGQRNGAITVTNPPAGYTQRAFDTTT